jgi:hypothetical protein
MSDEIDRANDLAQVLLEAAIQNAMVFQPKYPPNGNCYNCDEPLADGHRWCDPLCMEDFLYRERRK